MRQRLWQLLALLLLPTLVTIADASQREEQSVKLKQLRDKITALTWQLRETRGEESQLSRSLRTTERAIDQISRNLRLLEGREAKEQRALKKLESQRSVQQQQLTAQQTRLSQQLRSAYAMGQQGEIKLLLNQEQPASIGRMLVYYEYISRARTREIEEVSQSLAALQKLEHDISLQLDEINKLKSEQQLKQSELNVERQQRKLTLTQLKADILSSNRELANYKANEKQLEQLLRTLDEVLADIPDLDKRPFAKSKGKLAWPTKGRLTAHFGSRRPVGNLKWRGVMIDTKEGSSVRAVSHGRVAFADWLRGFGLLLIIDHGNGYMSLYGHNQSLYKEAGDWVDVGETVATVGDSGGQERSGLYFEIRHNGKPLNPTKWCRRPRHGQVG